MNVTLPKPRQKTATQTSPAGALGVMADIIKAGDPCCCLEELVKRTVGHWRKCCNAGGIIWLQI